MSINVKFTLRQHYETVNKQFLTTLLRVH